MMLEWFYKLFPGDQIYVMCTDDLSNPVTANGSLRRVAAFIGLEDFDFSETVSKGKFNTALKKGYSKATAWDHEAEAAHPAISPAFKQRLDELYGPFNERLFELMGRRCPWGAAA